MIKIGHWANTATAILLLGPMGPTQEVYENPVPFGLHELALERVYERASDLDQVFVDVSNPELAIAPDTEENYIGKITVNVRTSHKRTTH